jgi:hypothetical protein
MGPKGISCYTEERKKNMLNFHVFFLSILFFLPFPKNHKGHCELVYKLGEIVDND